MRVVNMKVVILAGGFGTRISEETHLKPKPMIEIGGKPILWHVMKIYLHYGFEEFIICCGYKGHLIKEYFSNYFLHMSNVTLDIRNNKMETHEEFAEPWKVTSVDTGLNTTTGGRLLRIRKYLKEENFCLTYGDDLKRINLSKLVDFHNKQKKIATVTAAQYPARFGILKIERGRVYQIKEKPSDGTWINGGYYVLEPDIFDYIKNDSVEWEREPLEKLTQDGQLSAYKYTGPYGPLDTLKDKKYLEDLWNSGKAYWKVW